MSVSILEIFSIGIGPSSSHTVGPMRASRRFLKELFERELHADVEKVVVELYGSLAMTGKGHATDSAVFLGLEGELPEKIDPNEVPHRVAAIESNRALRLFGKRSVGIDLQFLKGKRLPFHSNAIRYKAFDGKEELLHSQLYYSIGGGFVLDHQEAMAQEVGSSVEVCRAAVPYPYKTAEELLAHAEREGKKIWEIVLENERSKRSDEETRKGVFQIWDTMCYSVQRGLKTRGELPGGLRVQRRAADLLEALLKEEEKIKDDPTQVIEWVSLFALAVNEENAAGGRVVTAPTNGSAGVIPAVLHYAKKFIPDFDDHAIFRFFLTATAVGILFKEGASISAAEMGCQGEIGVSSAMAAAGLAEVLGGSNEQIAAAAEIAMEHHLGMTCDPVAGLVQIPCIERNTMGANKAIVAARLSLRRSGHAPVVSLDAVIRAMNEVGKNMMSIYKETSEGGLALQISVNVPAC